MRNQYHVESLQTEEAAIVKLKIEGFGAVFEAIGSSKRDPQDKHNPEVGLTLALSRAMSDLSKQLEKAARAQIVPKDPPKRLATSLMETINSTLKSNRVDPFKGVTDKEHIDKVYTVACSWCKQPPGKPCYNRVFNKTSSCAHLSRWTEYYDSLGGSGK